MPDSHPLDPLPLQPLSHGLQQHSYYINQRRQWVHIPPQSLMRILLVNQYICDFLHSCQNIWLLLLIAIYNPPKYIDPIILGLPFLIANRLKIPIINYAKKSADQELSYFLKVIIVAYLMIVFGQYLMIVSTEPQRIIDTIDIVWFSYRRVRVMILFLGWSMTSLALETVFTVNQQIEAILIKGGLEYEIAEISKISMISKISAYVLCFLGMLNVETYRKLFCIFSEIAYVCILLCFTGAGLMYNNNNFKVAYKERNNRILRSNETQSPPSKQRLFPGFFELYCAPAKLKIYSIVLCCTNVIKFTVRLYCTMWVTESFLGGYEMLNFKYGVQVGSVMLCMFTLPNYLIREYIRAKWRLWQQQRIKRILYEIVFIAITILTIICCYFSVRVESPPLLITAILLCSFLIANLQIFLQNDEQFIGVNVPEFQICQNSVFRLANYITLFGVPLFLHMLDLKFNKINAIYFIIIAAILLLMVKFYILGKVHQKKNKEDTEEKVVEIDSGVGTWTVGKPGMGMGMSIRKGRVEDGWKGGVSGGSGLGRSQNMGVAGGNKLEIKMSF